MTHASSHAALLQRHGLKPTPQRLAIARHLLFKPQHVSADQLLERLRDTGNGVSKATVYNTLGLFARKGLIREVSIDPARVVYDSNPKPHHHLFDVDTGELTDIPVSQVKVQTLPGLPAGTRVEGVDVVVRIRREASRAG